MAQPNLIYGQPDITSSDPGFFGPGSMTWKVHADPASLVGGVRALLLQALHPVAMAGVSQYSDFREDPWGRLTRTAEYIGVTSFGTTEEAERAAARVRMVHNKLGVDAPDLLMWVHAGFVDSLLNTYRRTVRMSDADADQYVKEQLESARLIGLDPSTVFSTVDELRQYIQSMRPTLSITPEAMEAARFIVVPPPLVPCRHGLARCTHMEPAHLPAYWRQRFLGFHFSVICNRPLLCAHGDAPCWLCLNQCERDRTLLQRSNALA